MLTAADFIRAQLKRLHAGFDKSLADLTPEQLHAVPGRAPEGQYHRRGASGTTCAPRTTSCAG